MNLVNWQSSRQNALLKVSRAIDYKNNIDLLKESMISGDLESTNQIIFKTKWTFLRLSESPFPFFCF